MNDGDNDHDPGNLSTPELHDGRWGLQSQSVLITGDGTWGNVLIAPGILKKPFCVPSLNPSLVKLLAPPPDFLPC